MARLETFRVFVKPAALIAIAWSIYHLYTAAFGAPHAMLYRPLHLFFGLAVVFAAFPLTKRYARRVENASDEDSPEEAAKAKSTAPTWMTSLDYAFVAVTALCALYYILNSTRISERITFIDELSTLDVVVGLTVLVLSLEACRRVVGVSLTVVALVFLAYQAWGQHLGGVLRHRGLELDRFVDLQLFSPQGVFGVPLGVSADYVFYFILFAAFLEVSGGGRLFIDLALAITGRARGGPAKAAMVGSALMGSINGSAVANVVGTGVFTIPLMKRTGYKAKFAGAVEAMASTGGQLLPPVMGAGAFIMAQMLGWEYAAVALAATIPALLYFVAGFFMVDKQAQTQDLRSLPKEERVSAREVLGRIHLLIPLVVLVYLILSGRSLMRAAFIAIIITLVIGFVRRSTWITPTAFVTALRDGGLRSVSVALPTAVAGIIVGVITQTNLGLRFTELVLALSGGFLIPALLLTMLGAIVLGLGMPTTSAYIMGAVLLTPPLIELGVPPIAAHLFVFYFACMSMLTPPVALAAFAAAGIAGSPLNATGWTAFRISLAAYLIPFAFVLSPALILQGDPLDIVWVSVTALAGTYALAGAVIGHQSGMLRPWQRILLLLIAVALIYPGLVVSAIAAVALVVTVVLLRMTSSHRPQSEVDRVAGPDPAISTTATDAAEPEPAVVSPR